MDEDHKASAMIALLPVMTDWCCIALPHMTLVYAGEVDDLPADSLSELAKDASALAQISKPITLRVTGKDVFGGRGYDTQVNVLTLENTQEVWSMRRFVERWNKSEYPFNPHVTVGPVGQAVNNVPHMIAFDRILVGWGKEYLTFNLRRR